MTLCRELTKRHETAFHTTIEELILYYQTEKPLGECVLVIEGRSRQEMEEEQKASWEKITIEEHMEIYENQGHSRKEAMKMVANDRGMTKRDVYQYLINSRFRGFFFIQAVARNGLLCYNKFVLLCPDTRIYLKTCL